MSKNKLTIEEQFLNFSQAKELKELGIDFDNCNYMILNGSKKIVAKSDILGFIGDDYTPTLSVAEMMEMLPIINEERFYIQITRECEIEYRYNNFSEFVYVIKYTESSNKKSFKVSGSILRDVLFEMLKWLVKKI